MLIRATQFASLSAWALVCLAPVAGRADDGLTALEKQWIEAAGPVLDYADALKVPLDIIVQPQPGDVPLAMGFDQGRCKLVLSLRANPNAQATLASIDPSQRNVAIETMAAHELAHCLRRVNGEWHTAPVGIAPASGASQDAEVSALRRKLEQTRREEGFADVFGLAWTLQHHPQLYPRIHAWIERVRSQDSRPGDAHDTGDWLRLTRERTAFDVALPLFERAEAVWNRGFADN